MTEYIYKICPICGVHYAVEKTFIEYRDRDGTTRTWHCPNGHSLVYRDSNYDKAIRERDAALQRIAEKEDELREAAQNLLKAEKKHKKLEKRTAAGTCPCCNRTFSNMARHMRHQHPEFVTDHTQVEIPPEDKVVPLRGRKKRA